MQTSYTPEAEEQHKLGAYLNARTTNYAHKSHFSNSQLLQIDRVYQQLKSLYPCASNVYVNYRKTKAAIKVTTRNTNLHTVKKDLAAYVQHLATQRVTVKHHPRTSSVIYSIPKI
tara:strand:+ start:2349 stop:2693 length:345 start_codon:yes stop_codon:yes gene_type:complete